MIAEMWLSLTAIKTNEEGMYWNQRGIEKDGRLIKINSQLE